MNLTTLLASRAEAGRPVRAALIGAGKFGSMFLSQVPTIPGLDVAVVADLDPDRARAACRAVGWDEARIGRTRFTSSGREAAEAEVDVVVEATGSPEAGAAHALAAIGAGRHVVMVNVEADVLVGPLLAARARERGVVYSMAYGDQPALVAEMVDWARAAGFTVAAAGKGTKYLPAYHGVTPDDVWSHYGLSPEEPAGRHEPADVQLLPRRYQVRHRGRGHRQRLRARRAGRGLGFPPCGVDHLAQVLRPRAVGGRIERDGMVEVVSSLERDGRPVFRDLRWGVYVVLKAPNPYAAACFRQYGLPTDETGLYTAMYKPFHLIGLELSISVLSAALRGEPTGTTREWRGDVAAVAKRDLKAGETLDGEGGWTVYGRAAPAALSRRTGALPIGLAHGVRLRRDVQAGAMLTRDDVEAGEGLVWRLRAEMEAG
jgi:predicted homoserine dehydrogenase-like protein